MGSSKQCWGAKRRAGNPRRVAKEAGRGQPSPSRSAAAIQETQVMG